MATRASGKTKAKAKGTKPKVKAKKGKRGIGDNSGQIPDEVYERHLKKIEQTAKAMDKAKLEYDQAKGVHQSAYKAAKGDGCNIDAIKLARKLDELDAGTVAIEYSECGRILKLMKSPLSIQLSLFEEIEIPKDVQAATDGKNAGALSAPRDSNPHKAGTPEFAAWDENYVSAQSNLSPELRAD